MKIKNFILSMLAITVITASLIGCPAPASVPIEDIPDTVGDTTPITLAAITGVTAPAMGETPDTAAIDTAQYTGSVAWTPGDNPYKGEEIYTATISLTPKAGFTLTGVSVNFFTVAGATATSAINSGEVEAVFTATGATPITLKEVGVTAPVIGEYPDTAITPTDQYTGTVTWIPDDSTYIADTAYTATIALVVETGYTLTGVAKDFFTIAGASVTNAVNAGVVVASFPKTAIAPLARVELGSAGDYVILAKTAISSTGATAITGDIGISPEKTASITGFTLLANDATNVFATASQVIGGGKIYASDMEPPTPDTLTLAVVDMLAAYTDAAGRATSTGKLNVGTGDIGGLTLAPRVYTWGSTVNINSNLVLSGGANDVWIFQITNNLNLANGIEVQLTGEAKPENVFWQVADDVTLGTTSKMVGIILGMKQIILKTGASVNGRLLSQTQVTLDATTVVAPVIL